MTSTLRQIPGYVVGTWDIDAAHSTVGFSVRHMMVSKVRGYFRSFSGELAHAHHAAGRLGERDQDLVVGVRDAGVVGELAVQAVLEELGAVEPRPPGALLLGVEPPRLRRRRRLLCP